MGREYMNEKKIPLTIGITGHLNPRMRDTLALRDAVKRELTKLRTRCPHTPMVMLCSLAQGADLLCAEAAEEVAKKAKEGSPVYGFVLAIISLHDRLKGKRTKWVDYVLYTIYGALLVLVTFLTFFSIHPLVGFGSYLLIIPSIHLCARIIYLWR